MYCFVLYRAVAYTPAQSHSITMYRDVTQRAWWHDPTALELRSLIPPAIR